MFLGKINSWIDKVYNRFTLKKERVQYTEIPQIRGRLFIRNKGMFQIAEDVRIVSNYRSNPIGGQTFCSFVVLNTGALSIGPGCGISNSAIYCEKRISIGKNVFIGGDCKIYDTDFHSLELSERILDCDRSKIRCKDVVIEDGAFIGTGTIILKGVKIGKASIIGAGSVVSKNVPDGEIWAGNPARFIRRLESCGHSEIGQEQILPGHQN